MKRFVLANITLMCINIVAHAQAPLPQDMKSLSKIKGFTDGTGYRIWSHSNSVDHLHFSWPDNKTVVYAQGLPPVGVFTYGDELYSPNGLCMAGNYYPARISEQYPIAQKDYRDWRTRVSIASRDGKGGLIQKDTSWYDDHFAVGIGNDGTLLCSTPKLKSKNTREKNELVKLTGLYTYNIYSKEEHQLFSGTIWTDEKFGTLPYRVGFTPNSKLVYYYDEEGIHFWDLATYGHLFIESPFDKDKPFEVSVGDVQTVLSSVINWRRTQVFINNITGEELYRGIVNSQNPEFFIRGNQLMSQGRNANISFWQLDNGEMIKTRSVTLDTMYMTDGPKDNTDRFKIEVISPRYAAVYNQYDRLYVMELDYGRSYIVYSDISGRKRAAEEADAAVKKAKEACKSNEDAARFKIGNTILLKGVPYIISSFNCYENVYNLTTVKPFTENPPYSAATVLRYDLKPVTKKTALTETATAKEVNEAKLSPTQYQLCEYCHGSGGHWVAEAVTGPSVLINTTTMKGKYKPLGTMVYNYIRCSACNGNCWFGN